MTSRRPKSLSDETLPLEHASNPTLSMPDVGHMAGHRRLKNLLRRQLFGTGAPVHIGRFEIRRQLGMGGMAVVYAAYDRELDRELAVKLIHSPDRDGQTINKRLRREAQAMARLAHPNVVPVYEVGEHDGQPYVAMELVEGETLRAWQTRQQRSWREILAIYMQAGQGLAAAHKRGIVHRDFKPDNVLVGRDGRARVSDFGLAHTLGASPDDVDAAPELASESTSGAIDDDDSDIRDSDITIDIRDVRARLTRTGALLGTLGYMSPEQFLGDPVDASTDQFSFCVALYEALYGERPFAGHNAAELAATVTRGDIRSAAARVRVPARLRAVLVRGLAVSGAQRFPDMATLLAQLERMTRIRRRFVAAALTLLVAGAGLGGAVAMGARADAPDLCRNLDSDMAVRWNAGRADTLTRAFVATGLPFAASTAARVTGELDTYASKWLEIRTNACRLALVEGARSAELYDLQTACLDRRQLQFAALIDQFVQPDAEVVERSYSAALALPDNDICENVELLRLGMQPPADTGVAAQVSEIRARLAAAAALRLAGKYRPAKAAARALVAEARALGYRPVLAEVLAELGTIEDHLGECVEAIDTLQEAIDMAEASRHDLLTASTWNQLIAAAATSRTQPERGLHWFRRARAAIERLGGEPGPKRLLMAGAYSARGLTSFALGAYDDAERDHRQALDLRAQELGMRHLHVARSLDDLANVLAMREHEQQAGELYEQALAIRIRALGENHPEVAAQQFNIGRLYAEMGQYERARAAFEGALARYRESFGASSKRTGDFLLALAALYEAQGDIDKTAAYAQEAVAIYERVLPATHPQRAKAANTWATVLFHQRRYEDALAMYERALAVFSATARPSGPDVAACHVNIADTLVALGRTAEALPHFQRASELFAASMGETHSLVAYSLAHLGQAYVALARPGDAIAPLQRAVTIYADKPHKQTELAATRSALARARSAQ